MHGGWEGSLGGQVLAAQACEPAWGSPGFRGSRDRQWGTDSGKRLLYELFSGDRFRYLRDKKRAGLTCALFSERQFLII